MLMFPSFTSQLMSTVHEDQNRSFAKFQKHFARIYDSVSVIYITLKH